MTYPERRQQRQEEMAQIRQRQAALRNKGLGRRLDSSISRQELAMAIDGVSDADTQKALSIMFEIITGKTVSEVLGGST